MDVVQLGPLVIEFKFIIAYLLVAIFFFFEKRLEKANKIEGLDYAAYAVIIGLVSGRAVFVIKNLEYYASDIFSAFNIFDRDFDFYGAVLGSILFTVACFFKSANRFKVIMQRVFLIIILSASYLIFLQVQYAYKESVTLALPASENVELADLLSSPKPKIINFWATWCPPCVKEMPLLIESAERNPDIIFIFINQNESQKDVFLFEKKFDIQVPNLFLNDSSLAGMEAYGKVLPTTLFLGRDNVILDTYVGAITAPTLKNKTKILRGK